MTAHFFNGDRSDAKSRENISSLAESRTPFLQLVGIVPDDYLEKIKDSIYSDLEAGAYGNPATIDVDYWTLQYWPKTPEYLPAVCLSVGNDTIGVSREMNDSLLSAATQGQALDVAAQVVFFAINLKWDGIQIVDGSRTMQWAIWAVANHNKLPCYGYSETEEDIEKIGRIAEILESKYTKDLDSSHSLKSHNYSSTSGGKDTS